MKLELRVTNNTVGDSRSLHLVGSPGGLRAEVTDDKGAVVAVMALAFWKAEQVFNNKQTVSFVRLS